MQVALSVVDPETPRTIFHQMFVESLQRNRRYAGLDVPADMRFPAEDVICETNWPRYGKQSTAFVRGKFDLKYVGAYLTKFVAVGSPGCVMNLNPFLRMPQILSKEKHIITADGNLTQSERASFPRTISMPAMPIVTGQSTAGLRPIWASFRGVNSHACRAAMAQLHDGVNFICQFVGRDNHVGRVDASNGEADFEYLQLLQQSVFALVPRGDAPFSYRLLEAMSCGCIPVVISDGWVLPFDRLVDWPTFSIQLPEAEVAHLPHLLSSFSAERIAAMQHNVARVYAERFSSLDHIVETLLQEVERLYRLLPFQRPH